MAGYSGAAAFHTLKPPTVSAEAPRAIQPLMKLSNSAVPQVQAATAGGARVGVAVAIAIPAVAAVAAVGGVAVANGIVAVGRAAPGIIKAGETAVGQVGAAAGGVAARYGNKAADFVQDALENAQAGSGPVEAFAGAGAGKAVEAIKGAGSGPKKSLGKVIDDFISMMAGKGSARGEGSPEAGARSVKIGVEQAEKILESAARPGGEKSTISQALRKLQRRGGDEKSIELFKDVPLTEEAASKAVRDILDGATSSRFGRLKLSGFEGEKGIAFFDDAGRGVLVRASDNQFITFLEARGLEGIFH